ncbi:MAG: hypothetical protein QG583_742 [Patescibacteria group bacterium]|nr:hypothetical protein [Patescibacteria group bacterium]
MEKIKHIITNSVESDTGKDILTVFIIILVGLGSFGLGRLSTSTNNSGISVEYIKEPSLPTSSNAISALNTVQNTKTEPNTPKPKKAQFGVYFASNRGSKYYSIGCSGGKTLKEENKIYFQTKEEAEKAGYEISSSCK